MARLVLQEGKAPEPVRHLGEFPCVVGRLASCGLQLDEPQSSRKHFRVERRGAGYVLVDLGSTNGTYLNHERVVGEAPLRHGDRIRVGDTVVVFESAPDPLPAGTQVGTVKVVSANGRTPSGALYVGRQGALDREVLLEVVDPDLAQDATFRKAYEVRARHAGALEHACVQAVFDTAADGERLYTVFESCPGQPLARRLEVGPAFDRDAALSVVRDLAQALAHVHARGQLHGLLSPAVVMVDGARVKLTGLGEAPGARIAKHRPDAPLLARYASPEEARDQMVIAASDVYSLGALCFHLLVGRPPYEGDTPKDVLEAHAASAAIDVPPSVEPTIAALLDAMLAKTATERPTAAEVERRASELLERRKGGTAAQTSGRQPERVRLAPPEPAAAGTRKESGRRDGGPPPGPTPGPRNKTSGRSPVLGDRPAPPPPSFLPLRLILIATGYGLMILAASLATRIALRFL